MNIDEEKEWRQKKVDLLKLQVEEMELQATLKNTGFIDETDCVLCKAKDRIIAGLHDHIGHIDVENCEFRAKIVELHTEIQDKDGRIKEIETKLGQLSPVILEIAEVVSEWLSTDKQPIGNLETLTKIAAIIDDYNRFLEDKYSGSAVPASVAAMVTKMEDVLNDGLPDGVEAKVITHQVTPKQMSEMLKITKED